MTAEQAIIESLLSSPDDWVTRSVLADWCDDNGQSGRADIIRSRLFRPYSFTSECPNCADGLVEMENEGHFDRMHGVEVTRDYRDHRGPVAYQRCRRCGGKGKVFSQHSKNWLVGLPCADEWLADHPTELGAMMEAAS